MRTAHLLLCASAATLMSGGATALHAAQGASAQGVFYDPSNAASPTGKTIGYELYRTIGCPGRGLLDTPCPVPPEKDSDGDGVVDSKDKCPDTPAGRKVNADGCELDSDGDGIADGDDTCPTVYAKTPDGCPAAAAAPVEPAALAPAAAPQAAPAPVAAPASRRLVFDDVNFDYDKATLRPEAHARLDEAAASLREWGDIKVEVAGHTDSRGSEAYNMGLSLRRAESVRNYLIGKGIPADRLVTKGYGESQPIADNSTNEGRFQNRRVELQPQK